MAATPSPLVSVILPTFNRPARLAGAVRSVLEQSYPNLELLVIDDASTVEGVPEAVAEGAGDDGRVRLERLEHNGGVSRARNVALGQATGELVAFIDDDDRWHPEKTAKQVHYLSTHPEVGLVTCDHLMVIEGSTRAPLHYRGPREVGAEQLLWANFVGGFSFVMGRRPLLGGELGIDETFRSVEDWDLWLRCARVTGVGVIPEPLVEYVFHGGPRLTDVDVKRRGLEQFEEKHGAAMSRACHAFHRAHQRMEEGSGWAKRRRVFGALASAAPPAMAMLLLEQATRQGGRMVRDPGLWARALARALA
ncbi:MAG TPA: glycosyltransferase [Acidimicrobiales bacterium]|nr:glycosyltransferase [Acidimicrobiales bacterium]